MRSRLAALGLDDVTEKLDAGVRLSFEDGVRLFNCPDTLALGWLANREREKRHGARTYYNFNIRLEATNVCVASCLFCSFARLRPGDAGSYTMSLEQAWDKLRQRAGQPLTEVHVVNGLHPDLPFSYYTDMLRGFKRIRPEIHLKCFTAVEIAFFADLYGKSDEQVLRELQDAGLDSLPGGGAEIFAERVRRKICDDKCGADRYLAIHRLAHRLGMRTNVTMLYGHIETIEERVDHMLRARALQDDTGGLQAFIPLAFHPDNNQMRKLPAPSAIETLRVHAVSRLMLDNIPHIKAFWIATGVETAQLALWFGADDLDGTVQEEHIYHMAGSRTPEGMTTRAIRHLIRTAGREPVRARYALQRDHRPGRGFAAWLRRMDIKLLNQVEKESIGERQPLPEKYLRLSDDEMDARITAAKQALGDRLVILGHHYQRDEVIKFADYIGDSLKLARAAATRHTAEYVDLLRRPLHGRERRHPARAASESHPPGSRRRLLDGRHGGGAISSTSRGASSPRWAIDVSTIIPVTYINSSAAIKAFVGRHGGVVCTSTNAAAVMTWAWQRGEKLMMLPDQHLGRNTACKLGVPLDRMVIWDPHESRRRSYSGAGEAREAAVVEGALFGSHAVHVAQIEAFRKKYPEGKVIAHPECTFDVVQAADLSGSTEFIIDTVKASPEGSVWAVATEIHLVNRLATQVAPARRSSRSIRSAACVRRCSASRRTTCSGSSKDCSRAGFTTRSSCPMRRSAWRSWRSIACCEHSLRRVRWHIQFRPCRTITPRWSPTSTSRRCGSTTTSITRRTSTT